MDRPIGLNHGQSIWTISFWRPLQRASLLLSIQHGTLLKGCLIWRRMDRRWWPSGGPQVWTASLRAQLGLDVNAWMKHGVSAIRIGSAREEIGRQRRRQVETKTAGDKRCRGLPFSRRTLSSREFLYRSIRHSSAALR